MRRPQAATRVRAPAFGRVWARPESMDRIVSSASHGRLRTKSIGNFFFDDRTRLVGRCGGSVAGSATRVGGGRGRRSSIECSRARAAIGVRWPRISCRLITARQRNFPPLAGRRCDRRVAAMPRRLVHRSRARTRGCDGSPRCRRGGRPDEAEPSVSRFGRRGRKRFPGTPARGRCGSRSRRGPPSRPRRARHNSRGPRRR